MFCVKDGLDDYRIDFEHHFNKSETKAFVEIFYSTTRVFLEGEAHCSEKDPWNRVVGEKIALSRAISSLPKEIRKKIWEEYFKIVGV